MKLPAEPSDEALCAIRDSIDEILGVSADPFLLDYKKYHYRRVALDYQWLVGNADRQSLVLEIGAFPFFLSNALIRRGQRLEIVDKMSDLAASVISKKNVKVTACDIEVEQLPFPDGMFDEVIFNEVFEHLRINPIFTMREILRVLKPAGRLWLSTPNLGSVKGICNLVFRNEAWAVAPEGVFGQYAHLETQGWMGHVREYTSREVARFLTRTGFEVPRIVYRGGYVNVLAQAACRIFPRYLPYFSCIATKPG